MEISTGDYVRVDADRGQDLGRVGDILPARNFWAIKFASAKCAPLLQHILRGATSVECQNLQIKSADEAVIVHICNEMIATTHPLAIQVVDAEFQFDRNKLTIFYDSNRYAYSKDP